MNNWNASNYRARKAQRLAQTRPEWIVNPKTNEQFYLRRVGSMMSTILAGYLPGGLTKVAVEAWKEKGVEGLGDPETWAAIAARMTPEQIEDGQQEMKDLSYIVQQCCVIPLLSNEDPETMTFSDEWRATAIKGLKEKDPHFDEAKFDPKDYVLSPRELDDADSTWLISWASGIGGTINIKGGGAMNIDDLERFREKPGRRSRVRANKPELPQTA